jgi:uncharacterized protein YjbI with pentapeptide repeats
VNPSFREFLFHALGCIRSSPSFSSAIHGCSLHCHQHGVRWVEEVAGLEDDPKIKELLRGFFGRRAVRVVGVVALLVVVVVLLFLILNWYVAPTKPSERKDLVLAVAQILGGTALLSGLYFTWRTLQVNREGQITERFTRAIDQLGMVDDQGKRLFEIRIGGIYALERIARESEEDHWPVMEILTAYVRQHAPARPEEDQQGEEDPSVQKFTRTSVTLGAAEEDSVEVIETSEVTALAPDIQAIMTVLRRRTRSFGHGEPEPLDLQETNLAGASLWRADFKGAWLVVANLSKANLMEANLSKANLVEAALDSANLSKANLSGAILWGATLSKARLMHADLRNADFSKANLVEVALDFADLSGAGLRNADLSGANLPGANLSEASLTRANLTRANLSQAYLAGTNLLGVQLTQAQLEETIGDENTQLPSDLKPPAHWGVKTDEQTPED